MVDFTLHAKTIVKALLGQPNEELSSKEEWRFGTKGSLAVQLAGAKAGTWYDHEAGEGGGMLALIMRERGVDTAGAFAWARDELGIGDDKPPSQGPTTTAWIYRDRSDQPVYRVVRRDFPGKPKRVHQERYDPATDSYKGGKGAMKDVPLLPYRLPELLAAPPDLPVLVAEGEKCVDALVALGHVATTNPGGAGKFRKGFSKYFIGRDVILLPDNDEPGRAHVHAVAKILRPAAALIRVLELPDLPEKGDVADWLAAGGTNEALTALFAAAPAYEDWTAEHAAPERQPEPASDADPRPEIMLRPERINEVIHCCSAVLVELVYLRGPVPRVLARVESVGGRGRLVEDRDGVAVEIAGVRHRPGSLLFLEPVPQLIGYHLDNRLRFLKYDGRVRDWVKTFCPPAVAQRVLGAATELGFRPCSGFSLVPLFHAGQIVATPGWHAETGLIIDAPRLGPIPHAPTKDDAKKALSILLRPFRDYGKDPKLRAAIAAGALTAVLRPSLETAPAIMIEGNTIGVGKGKLARAYGALNMGSTPSIVTEGHNAEELEKRLASAILQGSPAIMVDNLQRRLESSTLESLLSEDGIADIRAFGTLTSIQVRSRALVTLTANNARIRRDLLRRLLKVRIVVRHAQPWLRHFEFDPVAETLRDRAELITAAFTIVKAWHHARQLPDNAQIGRKPLGSFEQWAEVVAGAVEWLTTVNPVDLVDDTQSEDPAALAERQVIQHLVDRFRGNGFAARAAAPAIDLEVWLEVLPEIKDTKHLARYVGNWLMARRDRTFQVHVPSHEEPVAATLDGEKKDRAGFTQWKFTGDSFNLWGAEPQNGAEPPPPAARKLSEGEEEEKKCDSYGSGAETGSAPFCGSAPHELSNPAPLRGNGQEPERVGTCTYCRDPIYTDEETAGGSLHRRCAELRP